MAQHRVPEARAWAMKAKWRRCSRDVRDQDLDRLGDQTGPAPRHRPPEPRAASSAASAPTPRPARARARPCCRSGGRTRWARRPAARATRRRLSESKPYPPSICSSAASSSARRVWRRRSTWERRSAERCVDPREECGSPRRARVSTPVHATHVGVITDVHVCPCHTASIPSIQFVNTRTLRGSRLTTWQPLHPTRPARPGPSPARLAGRRSPARPARGRSLSGADQPDAHRHRRSRRGGGGRRQTARSVTLTLRPNRAWSGLCARPVRRRRPRDRWRAADPNLFPGRLGRTSRACWS